ncbi:hypothetical protein BN130_238 [Cronobacter malonaticus 507]|nr:hypothetical protein BN130_238 [Cronobacter malonaticus 507]
MLSHVLPLKKENDAAHQAVVIRRFPAASWPDEKSARD